MDLITQQNILDQITRLSQSQEEVEAQLLFLCRVSDRLGLYDATDVIENTIKRMRR